MIIWIQTNFICLQSPIFTVFLWPKSLIMRVSADLKEVWTLVFNGKLQFLSYDFLQLKVIDLLTGKQNIKN